MKRFVTGTSKTLPASIPDLSTFMKMQNSASIMNNPITFNVDKSNKKVFLEVNLPQLPPQTLDLRMSSNVENLIPNDFIDEFQ